MQSGKLLQSAWAIVAAGVAFVAPSLASAAFVPWSQPSGSNSFISYSGGGSTDGLWGNPVVSGLTFSFHPDEFRAQSNGVSSQTVDGLLRFDVDILPDQMGQPREITGFSIGELGSYAITGIGSVSASGLLDVQNRDTLAHFTSTMTTTPGMPISQTQPFGGVSGQWSAFSSVVLPNGITRVTITVDNTLQAISAGLGAGIPGGTAFIDKKAADAGLTISIFVPEPASIATLGLLGGSLLVGRRRN